MSNVRNLIVLIILTGTPLAHSQLLVDSVTNLVRVPVVITDTDGDNIDFPDDNCSDVFNPDQRDTDGDGYGNDCDPDLNNDGIVNFLDVALWVPFFSTPTNGDADFNDDGTVNFLDYIVMVSRFFMPPGPSDLHLGLNTF